MDAEAFVSGFRNETHLRKKSRNDDIDLGDGEFATSVLEAARWAIGALSAEDSEVSGQEARAELADLRRSLINASTKLRNLSTTVDRALGPNA
jgi:hypothetical protein